MKKFLIIFNDGAQHTIDNVVNLFYREALDSYLLVGNGSEVFIPAKGIRIMVSTNMPLPVVEAVDEIEAEIEEIKNVAKRK